MDRALLVGREPHLEVLYGAIEDARDGQGRAVTVCGEAGSGKTALLNAVATSSQDAMQVVRITGHPAESDLTHAGVHHLAHEAGLDLAAGSFGSPARSGGPIDREPPAPAASAASADPLRDALALMRALTTLSERTPLLLVVDDAHWLDRPSHRALVFVARRLRRERVALLIGLRTPHEDHLAVGTRLDVGPISDEESIELLRASHPGISARVAAKIAAHGHGLPLALREIPGQLSPAQLHGLELLPATLPAGPTLLSTFAPRIAALPDRTVLALLAASFEELSPDTYRSVLADLGCTFDDLDEAERSGLARLRDRRCEFRHPLLPSIVRSEARSKQVSDVRRVLAERLADDPVRAALHVAEVLDVDPGVRAATCVRGAIAATDARRLDEAATLWTLAAQPSTGVSAGAPAGASVDVATDRTAHRTADPTAHPSTDPAAVERRARLREAVRCLALAGYGAEARSLVERLLTVTSDPAERASFLEDLVWMSMWTGSVTPIDDERLESESLELLRSDDPRSREAAKGLLAARATALLGAGAYRRAHESCLLLRAHAADAFDADGAGGAGDRLPLERRLLCDVISVMVGEPGSGAVLRAGHEWVDSYPWDDIVDPKSPTGFLTVALGWLGEHETLERASANARRAAEEHGPSAAAACIGALTAASRERDRGRWDRALAEFESLERIVVDSDFAAPLPFIALRHAHLLAARGEQEGCRRVRRRARQLAPAWIPALRHLDLAVAGLAGLARRDYGGALTDLEAAADIEEEMGLVTSGYLSRFADTFEAAWRLGRAEEHHDELDRFERSMRALQHPTMLGFAARCRALIAEPDTMDTVFATAVEQLSGEPDGFETARTHLLWGERLRRARRKAAAHRKLTLAHRTFVRLGARSWAEHCVSELAACGIRRRRDPDTPDGPLSDLTPRELDVVRAVGSGLTNAEAARQLYVSTRTVESHLYNVFRKLDIDGRDALVELIDSSP